VAMSQKEVREEMRFTLLNLAGTAPPFQKRDNAASGPILRVYRKIRTLRTIRPRVTQGQPFFVEAPRMGIMH
jgi:hypothetical protein